MCIFAPYYWFQCLRSLIVPLKKGETITNATLRKESTFVLTFTMMYIYRFRPKSIHNLKKSVFHESKARKLHNEKSSERDEF